MNTQTLLEKGKESVALRVMNNRGYDVAHIELSLVYYMEDKQSHEFKMGFYKNAYDEKHKYENLAIVSQQSSNFDEVYGYQLVHREGLKKSLDLHSLEDIIKSLRPLERKLRKIADTEGEPRDFIDFVLRVVRVANVKGFFHEQAGNRWEKYNPNTDMLPGYLKSIIQENKEYLASKVA